MLNCVLTVLLARMSFCLLCFIFGFFYLADMILNPWFLGAFFPFWCVANPAVLSVAVPIALPPAHQML